MCLLFGSINMNIKRVTFQPLVLILYFLELVFLALFLLLVLVLVVVVLLLGVVVLPEVMEGEARLEVKQNVYLIF